jgi:Spy/CpxP family protein refolding chaperone
MDSIKRHFRSDPWYRRWRKTLSLAVVILTTATTLAGDAEATGDVPGGHQAQQGAHTTDLRSPYAKLRDAGTSGLLPEEVEGLRKGSGMALSLAAEVNGYPGPRHVLEAADASQLALRSDQRSAVQRLYDRMLDESRAKGQEILQAEAHLAQSIRHGHVDDAGLRKRLERIGLLRVELRFVHLRTHLETQALLTPDQIARYNTLRGYTASSGDPKPHAP